MATSAEISERIVNATLERRLAPGARLGEQELAELFGCSRTIVREALLRLEARGIVSVAPRRGWFLARPGAAEADDAFNARRAMETGLIRCCGTVPGQAVRTLRAHLRRQQAAVKGKDPALRSFLLGDFHVCLARALGHGVLVGILRDLTVRTTLVALDHQTQADAAQSCAEHAAIVDALEAGDLAAAERCMHRHLGTWKDKIRLPEPTDALTRLRAALRPPPTPTNALAG